MSDPMLHARGGNGKSHPAPELANGTLERKLGLTERAAKWMKVVIGITAAVTAAWVTYGERLKANEREIAILKAKAEAHEMKDRTNDVAAARLETKLDGLSKQLEKIDDRLESMETARNSGRR